MQHEPDPAPRSDEGFGERIDALAAWISDLDGRLRATELATGDEATAKELRRALETLAKHDPKFEKRLTDRVEVLSDRHATLASTVSTTAAALARKDGELAALRRHLDDSAKRLEKIVRERTSGAGSDELEALRAAIRALEANAAPAGDARIDGLGGKVEYLGERVDTLAKTVATTAAGLAGREGDLAVLRQMLNERSQQIDAAIAELRRHEAGALTERLDDLQATVDSATGELVTRESEIVGLRRRIDEAYSRVGTVVVELQHSIEALTGRVGELSGSRDTSDPAFTEWAAEQVRRVDGVASRLDEVTAHTEQMLHALAEERRRDQEAFERAVVTGDARFDSAVAEVRNALHQSTQRLEAIEQQRDSVAASLGVEARRWSEEHEHVRAQLAALAAEIARRTGATGSAIPEDALGELTRRLDVAERDRETLAAAVAEASQAWADVRGDVETRLDALGTQLEQIEASGAGGSGISKAQEAEVSQLRVAVEGLRMRLAAGEKELAGLTGPHDVGPRLEVLDRRLHALEHAPPAIVAPALGDAGMLPGDGRFRLELRALELRMEHAEAAARENREAVLVQLERLAARIEWRFQRLEAGEPPAPAEQPSEGGGQVVPIRGLEV